MGNLKKYKKVAILSGGISKEYEIAKMSAKAVYDILKNAYEVKLIDVKNDCLSLIKTIQNFEPDVVFNCLHGYFGEDGQVQSILNLLNIPYTHSGVLASSVAMNKKVSKKFFKALKINVPLDLDPLNINKRMFPVISKPINGGSSNDISIIYNNSQLKKIIKKIGPNSDKFIFEKFIKGRELTVGIINNKVYGIMELKYKSTLYDFENKYINIARHIINPKLDKNIKRKLKNYSLKAHNTLGCNCVSRIDFRYDETMKKIYLLEVNTQPGLTKNSLLPEMAEKKNITFFELCEILINNAKCE